MRSMNQRHAAGRKTENSLGLLGQHLDRQLGLLTQALGNCLGEADAVPREQDEYGHHRAREIGHAVTMAKVSARLVASLAKVSREFQHNIIVSHRPEEPAALEPSPPIRRTHVPYVEPDPDDRLTPEELDAMTDEEIVASMGIPPRNSRGSNG